MKKNLPFSHVPSSNTRFFANRHYIVIPFVVALLIMSYSFMQLTYRANLPTLPDLVFVSRPIADYGTFYLGRYKYILREDGTKDTLAMPKGMPGVGGHSRFRVSPGGKLMIRKSDGTLKVLIDGAKPGKRPDGLGDLPFKLIDVNAPDVSYDAKQIVFAGALEGTYESLTYNPNNPARGVAAKEPSAWRLFVINVDGTGLRQLTKSDRVLNLSQFASSYGENRDFESYDDTDPVWLPDGRIAFSSSRFPVYSHYTGVRATHLYVVNADGTNLHRITTERNSADRPVVDPLTGRIIFSRWWRNHHYPYDDVTKDRLFDPANNPDVISPVLAGYDIHEGVTGTINISTENSTSNNPKQLPDHNMFRNAWQLQAVNPDGSHLSMLSGYFRDEEFTHAYGGAFDQDGNFVANYYPVFNMTEAAGFGGIRRYKRGAGLPEALIGVTKLMLGSEMTYRDTVVENGIKKEVIRPITHVYKSDYASDPVILSDGKMVISWVPNTFRRINQDYGLYWFDPADRTAPPILIYNNPGTAELRAKPIVSRPKPPIIPDVVTATASSLPPKDITDITQDGTFVFDDVNVFFNAPVDAPIVSAPKIGDVKTIRFYANPQRHNVGSFFNLEWPIFLKELNIDANGAVKDNDSPANVQLFEQLRKPDGRVPLTGGPRPNGAAHVAGLNFGRPGEVVRCVGCHAGHSMIPVPTDLSDQLYTNLAPGANVTFSSSLIESNGRNHANYPYSVIDRKVLTLPFEERDKIWVSSILGTPGQTEWVDLTFDVPIRIREVRLYNFKLGSGEPFSKMDISKATVKLFSDLNMASAPIATNVVTTPITTAPTSVPFANQPSGSGYVARRVRVELNGSGAFRGLNVLGLAEIEVIAAANYKEDPLPVTLINFEAKPENTQVQLRWATSEESNSDHFDIERSPTGKSWQKIGQVAANGSSNTLKTYQFTDMTPLNGVNYYRLKMVDQDKSYTFSSIRKVTMESANAQLKVFPNPVAQELSVNYDFPQQAPASLTVTNSLGQVMLRQKMGKAAGSARFNVRSWPDGMYNVTFHTDGGPVSKKVLIQH